MSDFDSSAVSLRAAEKSDCRTIAALYRISSDGVADYIWSKLAEPGEDLLDVGRRRYEREESVFSYRNCTVAVLEGEVLGMLIAFPMRVDEKAGEEESDPVLAPYGKLEEDNSYYICGVALFPPYRGHGLGSRFLELAENQARERKLPKLSLIVFEQNAGARRLYERRGYLEVAREPVVPHPLIQHTGDALLMVKRVRD
ncbi:MAG TPA: GNAT family N-acetyltransferase [Gammaproteobacteria bacterium]|nr:GNAT family N-acetyltransferase [Gammaproteobacteria bacterium]